MQWFLPFWPGGVCESGCNLSFGCCGCCLWRCSGPLQGGAGTQAPPSPASAGCWGDWGCAQGRALAGEVCSKGLEIALAQVESLQLCRMALGWVGVQVKVLAGLIEG